MFSTLSGGRRYPGSIAHRTHKNVTFGKIAIGVAKGTAMIVIGVPVCTIAAGLGATAIVAYGLASPFYYGGKKLVRKIRQRRLEKKEELMAAGGCCVDRLTREDILVWLENCEEADDYLQQDDTPLVASPTRSLEEAAAAASAAAGTTTGSTPVAPATAAAGGGGGGSRKKPTLRRLFSRESRSFLFADSGAVAITDEGQQQQQQPQRIGESESPSDEPEQAELWKEMESVVTRLRADRLSICPENVVTMDQPLLLTNEADVLQFIRQLKLDGHLGELTRASSLPCLTATGADSTEATATAAENLDGLAGLPGRQSKQKQQQQQRKYKRTVSEGCSTAGLQQMQQHQNHHHQHQHQQQAAATKQ